ncbi:hypothetical protein [Streptomyces roseochromogenus]|uniref:hypothetical protein n=1 Tax=Streptomyces roseochromogenus TaxID=285450 RepID=UPI001FD7F43F|nr:hypothetical protein [Streptomyces roseochromogenus]
MMLQLDDVRVSVMRRLYQKQEQRPWDGEWQDLLDTALDLTLGHKRAADNAAYLCRNVIRDARRTLHRSAASSREAAACRPLADAARRRVCTLTNDGRPTAEMVTQASPEAWAIAEETFRELREFAAGLGAHGLGCLQGMLDRVPASASAKQTGVSIATVERTRRAIRLHAQSLAGINS